MCQGVFLIVNPRVTPPAEHPVATLTPGTMRDSNPKLHLLHIRLQVLYLRAFARANKTVFKVL